MFSRHEEQVARMTPGYDDRCPNCLQPQERAAHLNLCPSHNRTKLFLESVEDLSKWLKQDHTHPEIAFWLPRYLKGRGRVAFVDLPSLGAQHGLLMSSQMKMVAAGQDSIGWTHLLEGKITGHFKGMQQRYLSTRPSRINGADWCRMFIAKLLKISHDQWIFRNFTLHDKQHGHLAMLRREELAQEIERLQSLDPADVPADSRFLLDFNIDDLAEGDIGMQEEWIYAITSARKAGMRAQRRSISWSQRPRRLRQPRRPAQPFRPVRDTTYEDVFGDMTPRVTRPRPSDAVLSLLEPSNKRRRRRKKVQAGYVHNA